MEDIPNNLDDYGFLTCRGFILDKNYVSQTNSQSVDDLLLDVNKNSRPIFGKRHHDDVRIDRSRKQGGNLHSRLSTSQPSLNKCKKEEKRTIKVRFEINDIHTKQSKTDVNESRNNNVTDTKHAVTKDTNKMKNLKEGIISQKPSEEKRKNKETWWKHWFRSSKSKHKEETKQENFVKYKSTDVKNTKLHKAIYDVNESVEILENISFSELDGNIEQVSVDPNASVYSTNKSECEITSSTQKCKTESKRMFEVKKLTSSPYIKRRVASADNLIFDPGLPERTNIRQTSSTNSRTKNSSQNAKFSFNSEDSENFLRKSNSISKKKQKNQEVLKSTRSHASIKPKSRFSFRLGRKRNSIQLPLENEYMSESLVQNESTSKAFHDYDDIEGETHLKSLYVPDGSMCSASSVYEKYPANKGSQRKVLVHIHTKEEIPIRDGIPQWVDLSYQCTSALQRRHRREDANQSRRYLIRPLVESSFIGEIENSSAQIDNKQTQKQDDAQTNGITKTISENVREKADENISTVEALVHYCPTKVDLNNINNEEPNSTSKNENDEVVTSSSEPSYFEVTTDGLSKEKSSTSNCSVERGHLNQIETERSFALTGMATDEIPQIIARRHPYLAASEPVRHMAKCLRQAPISRPKEKLSPVGSNAIHEGTAVQQHRSIRRCKSSSEDVPAEERHISDSEYSVSEYTPLKIPQLKETAFGLLKHKKTSPTSASNVSLERIKETNDILVRMKERIQRLESISDESNSIKSEQTVFKQESSAMSSCNKQMKASINIPTCCISQNLPNMASLPLPSVKSRIETISDDDKNRYIHKNYGKSEIADLKTKYSKQDDKFRRLLYQKIKERSSQNGGVSQVEVPPNPVESQFTPISNYSTYVSCDIHIPQGKSTMTNDYVKHENTNMVENKVIEYSPQPVASPTRRRLRIMPFTLPLPKSTRYSSEGIFGDSQFGIDHEDIAGYEIDLRETQLHELSDSLSINCNEVITKNQQKQQTNISNNNLEVVYSAETQEKHDDKTGTKIENIANFSTKSDKKYEIENSAYQSNNHQYDKTTNLKKIESQAQVYPYITAYVKPKLSQISEIRPHTNTIQYNENESPICNESNEFDVSYTYSTDSSIQNTNNENGCGYLDEITGQYFEKSEEKSDAENKSKNRLQNIIFQQEQIKTTILNEMHLVRSRYFQSDENEISQNLSRSHENTQIGKKFSRDQIFSSTMSDMEEEYSSADDETLCDSVETISVLGASDDSMVTQQGSESSCYSPIRCNNNSESKLNSCFNNSIASGYNYMSDIDNSMPKAIDINRKTCAAQRYWRKNPGKRNNNLNKFNYVCDDYETDL
ncbi:uncharacterized protein LOC144411903 [Styela clava]